MTLEGSWLETVSWWRDVAGAKTGVKAPRATTAVRWSRPTAIWHILRGVRRV